MQKRTGKTNFLIAKIGKRGREISGVNFYKAAAEQNMLCAKVFSGAAEVRQ